MPLVRPTRGRRQRQCDPASESRTLAAGWQTRAGERSIAPERPCGLELTACGCAASLGMVAGQLLPAARRKDTDRASLASGQNQLSRTIADRDASCKLGLGKLDQRSGAWLWAGVMAGGSGGWLTEWMAPLSDVIPRVQMATAASTELSTGPKCWRQTAPMRSESFWSIGARPLELDPQSTYG